MLITYCMIYCIDLLLYICMYLLPNGSESDVSMTKLDHLVTFELGRP